MSRIEINEAHHGPSAERRYNYEPTYILRGLSELHLTFTTADSVASGGLKLSPQSYRICMPTK